MTDVHISLFCLVDGKAPSNAFPVKMESTKTVGSLKERIKIKKTPKFGDIAVDELTLCRISIPITKNDDGTTILLDNATSTSKKRLSPRHVVLSCQPKPKRNTDDSDLRRVLRDARTTIKPKLAISLVTPSKSFTVWTFKDV
ncbi:hypothetical protein EC991_009979 [Linnemannia zychae]|nr:hypothetical protein EC991_009979 [Linnemannia zychae]